MDDTVRGVLRELVGEHGAQTLIDDPRRCKALLSDHCPAQRREVAVLVAAAEMDIPRRLLDSDTGAQLNSGTLAAVLESQRALAPEAARWAVRTWAHALGVAHADDEHAPQPRPDRSPSPPRAEETDTPQRPPEPPPRSWGEFTSVNAVLAILGVWVAVLGFSALSTLGAEDLCHVHITGRPPFVWIRPVGFLGAEVLGVSAQSCHALATQFLLAAAAGLGLSLAAWRNEWF